MKSSDLILFREICDEIDTSLHFTLQMPDDEFKSDVESGEYFNALKSDVEYDFDEIESKVGVKLRYYQKLALYFTKYYFDKKYLMTGNDNNKLTYWMATGSGKTVIMKSNIIDYFEYLRDKNPYEIEVIITSPLKELIGQLQKEMEEFFASSFFRDFKFSYKIETTQGLIERYKNESHEIVGENQYRLLLVDEAHIGLGKSEKGAFVKLRDDLTKNSKNSFMFEYSATFYDVKNKVQIDEYAKRIIFEYDYGKFYNDRYGKDFRFGVVRKDDIAEDENKDIKRNLDINIEEFYKKLRAFNKYNKIAKKEKRFEDKPLLIMAGNTVSASNEKQANNPENSDIAKILDYFANLDDNTIQKYEELFNSTGGTLHLLQNTMAEGEILLSFGEDIKPFGLITIGDVRKFLENSNIVKLIEEKKIIYKSIKFANENYLFKNIDFASSPINILIGSRKFSAGWNSFRASQICLINFGTGSGSTIIQMFGRGVRLKGIDKDGKRQVENYVDDKDGLKTEFLPYSKGSKISKDKYEQLKYLETLFIYSLRSTYLTKFIEEDTDIYKQGINYTKKVEVPTKKELPIFYIDKTFQKREQKSFVTALDIEDNKLKITYEINGNKKETFISLPIRMNLNIEKELELKYTDFAWLFDFIDISYIEKYFIQKEQKSGVIVDGLDLEFIQKLLESGQIKIIYDFELIKPIQLQKLLVKVFNTFILKISNKIKYVENSKKYQFDKRVESEDYIDEYNVKFIVESTERVEDVKNRLEKDKNFKIFTEKFLNHYYLPLAVDPNSKTKDVYESFEKCGYKEMTLNMKNIFDCYEKYFDGVEAIKITPDKIDQYEFKFLCDLQHYIIKKENISVTVLRNKASGNIGIISSEDEGIFYPDFILWYKEDSGQEHIIFCDPKGIRNAETKWKVCDAPYEIKKIEKKWDNNIKLHSFIISHTKLDEIAWKPIKGLDKETCHRLYNLVFFDDEGYIDKIFKGLNTPMDEYDYYFQKNIEHFDKETINEWLDDEWRKKHIDIIREIESEEGFDKEKAMLLYLLIWEKKDRLTEEKYKEILEDLKNESKDQLVNRLIEEFGLEAISSILPGAKIGYKVITLLFKRIRQFKE